MKNRSQNNKGGCGSPKNRAPITGVDSWVHTLQAVPGLRSMLWEPWFRWLCRRWYVGLLVLIGTIWGACLSPSGAVVAWCILGMALSVADQDWESLSVCFCLALVVPCALWMIGLLADNLGWIWIPGFLVFLYVIGNRPPVRSMRVSRGTHQKIMAIRNRKARRGR